MFCSASPFYYIYIFAFANSDNVCSLVYKLICLHLASVITTYERREPVFLGRETRRRQSRPYLARDVQTLPPRTKAHHGPLGLDYVICLITLRPGSMPPSECYQRAAAALASETNGSRAFSMIEFSLVM